MLLLFSVRMVRAGIERGFGDQFTRLMRTGSSPLRMIPIGVIMAIVLQSSAAVGLLAANFAAAGTMSFSSGVAMLLGADLGSAILISVLSLDLSWLMPLLLLIGGFLYLKSERRTFKQSGRVFLGISLILISLGLLRGAVAPIQESNILPSVAGYLSNDLLTAFLAGSALAFLMHSSVAMVLMVVAVVGLGAIPANVGLALVLGANLGSALIPVWLTRSLDVRQRRIPVANLVLRGAAAIIALFVIDRIGVPSSFGSLGPSQMVVAAHVTFNALLLPLVVLAQPLDRLVSMYLPDTNADAHVPLHHRSVLDETALSTPVRALGSMRREVLRMSDVLSGMLIPAIDAYSGYDREKFHEIRDEDQVLNKALDGIRLYAAKMPRDDMDKAQNREMRTLIDYAIALEAAGDIVSKRLMVLAKEMHDSKLKFSAEGAEELAAIHARVVQNLKTAATVLVSGDVDSARLLLEEKADMARQERRSRKRHLKRLSAGDLDSLGSSDVHIETAYSLKEMNSWIVTIAHPILLREGQLLETRLAGSTL